MEETPAPTQNEEKIISRLINRVLNSNTPAEFNNSTQSALEMIDGEFQRLGNNNTRPFKLNNKRRGAPLQAPSLNRRDVSNEIEDGIKQLLRVDWGFTVVDKRSDNKSQMFCVMTPPSIPNPNNEEKANLQQQINDGVNLIPEFRIPGMQPPPPQGQTAFQNPHIHYTCFVTEREQAHHFRENPTRGGQFKRCHITFKDPKTRISHHFGYKETNEVPQLGYWVTKKRRGRYVVVPQRDKLIQDRQDEMRTSFLFFERLILHLKKITMIEYLREKLRQLNQLRKNKNTGGSQFGRPYVIVNKKKLKL